MKRTIAMVGGSAVEHRHPAVRGWHKLAGQVKRVLEGGRC